MPRQLGSLGAGGTRSLCRDTFSGLPMTNIHGKSTEEGGLTWTVHEGSMEIDGGEAVTLTGATGNIATATVDPGTTAYIARLAVPAPPASGSDPSVYLVFRYQNTTNYWIAGVANGATGSVVLLENNAGAFTNRLNVAHSWNPGDIVTVTNLGNDISVYVNDVLKGSYSSSLHATQTRSGMQGRDVLGARFDDFQVLAL